MAQLLNVWWISEGNRTGDKIGNALLHKGLITQ